MTPALLSALGRAGIKATFFDVGQRAQNFPDYVRAQHALGHAIGNHSNTHADLVALGEPGALAELSTAQSVLTPLAGAAPALFRPPYGSTSTQVKTDAASLGMTEVIWTVDTRDWSGVSTSSIVSSALQVQAGGFVLMHDGYANTISAIPKIAAGLAARGLCAGKIVYNQVPTISWDGGPAFNASVAAWSSTLPVGPPPPGTGPTGMSLLVDNFNAASFDTTRWDGSSVGVVGQSAGRGFIPCTTAYPTIGTNTTYDLTNAGAFAHFAMPDVGAGSREAFFQLSGAAGNQLQWIRSGDTFRPRYSVGGTWTDGPALTYNAVTHAWWRIHSAAGNLLWDTSPDGVTWQNEWSVPSPFTITAMTVNMICGYWGTETAASMYVDNFNVAPA
jgi:hypothetical protein